MTTFLGVKGSDMGEWDTKASQVVQGLERAWGCRHLGMAQQELRLL